MTHDKQLAILERFGIKDDMNRSWGLVVQELAVTEQRSSYIGKKCKKCGNTERDTKLKGTGHTRGECKVCMAEGKATCRANRIHRIPSWFNEDHQQKIRDLIIERDRLTASTGIPHHIDHIIPLQGKDVSGLHLPSNLQILTESQNCSKGNRYF